MANQRLTNGALLRYLRGNTSEKAILQVVGIKNIDSKTDGSSGAFKCYRLMLSDGKNTFSSCMLSTQMNKLIETKSLKENSIVRIDRATVNPIDKQSGRIILMLCELEVLQSNCERIGDPVALPLTDIFNSNTSTDRLETTNENQASASVTHVIQQVSKVIPTLDNPKKPTGDNRLNSKETNVIDKERIININTLNPFINRWTIKARVSDKKEIRSFENVRGRGKYFSCDLVDQSGEIRATAFNAECDKFYSMLEVGKVYYITKASIKAANRQFNTTKNEYEMTLNHDTIIEACDVEEGENIPQVQFNFIPISEIANRATNSTCDVVGVVKSASDVHSIVSKISQKKVNKREVLLVDEKASITVSLWGQQAEEFDGSSNPIVAFKGIKIDDFKGRSLSCLNSTLIRQDPTESERTVELRVWYNNEGKSMDLPDLSKRADISTRQTPVKTISQIFSEGLGHSDKPDYVCVKAMITYIQKDTAVYMMCPGDKCGKKVVDEMNGSYRCEKCNKTYENFKWAYLLSAEISDATGTHWILAFRNEAEAIMGITADALGDHKLKHNESIIEDITRKAMNHERIFKLRVKAEQHNDEQKIRLTCMNVSDVDWSSHGKHLIAELHHQIEPVKN